MQHFVSICWPLVTMLYSTACRPGICYCYSCPSSSLAIWSTSNWLNIFKFLPYAASAVYNVVSWLSVRLSIHLSTPLIFANFRLFLQHQCCHPRASAIVKLIAIDAQLCLQHLIDIITNGDNNYHNFTEYRHQLSYWIYLGEREITEITKQFTATALLNSLMFNLLAAQSSISSLRMFHSVENSGMLESSSAVNANISSSSSLFFLCKNHTKCIQLILFHASVYWSITDIYALTVVAQMCIHIWNA